MFLTMSHVQNLIGLPLWFRRGLVRDISSLQSTHNLGFRDKKLLSLILPRRCMIVLLGETRNFELGQRGNRYVPVRLTEHSHRVTRFNLTILSVHQLRRESHSMACRA